MILAAIEPGNVSPKSETPARIADERARLGTPIWGIGVLGVRGVRSQPLETFEIKP